MARRGEVVITREAEQALFEISRQRATRVAKLEFDLGVIRRIALAARDEGDKQGAVIWRGALEEIIRRTS